MPSPPFTESLIKVIEDFVIELVQLQFDQRKAIPEAVSTHYLQFENDYMKRYKDDDKVTHVTIRHLLRWVFENQAATSDPTDVITAIKFISPNIEALDDRTMAAVVQALIITGEGVLPTVNSNPDLLPYETGFNLSSDLVKGQFAWNETDNIWFIRIGNAIVDFRTALGLQISHIEGLQDALDAASIGGYTFNDPLESDIDGNVDLKYDPATLGIDNLGRLAVVDGVGNYLSTALPGTFTNDQLVVQGDSHLLIIEHGKNTTNVKLHIRDNTGKEVFIPYDPTTDPNVVTVDFGSEIPGTWTYILEYWVGQSNGQYPDPTYAPAVHDHNGLYSPLGHTHSGFADVNHLHDDRYPLKSHNHDQSYAAYSHNHNSSYEAIRPKGYIPLNLLGRSAQANTDDFTCYYDGKTMIIYMKISFLSNYVSNTLIKIGSIPTFPPSPVEFPGSFRDTSASQSCFGRIENGNIFVQSGIASRTALFNFSFAFTNLILP